jgi:hypothetical protein
MATLEQLEKALVNAHNAGDADTARRFAAEIKRMRKPPEAPVEAEDPGAFGAGVIATGRTLDRLYKGLKQGALTIPATFGHAGSQDELGRMEKEEAENTRIYEGLKEKRPYATMAGEIAPLLAAPMLGSSVAGMAASAALPGLAEYGTGTERLQRGAYGAAGGALGGMAGKVAARVLQPTKGIPDAAIADAVAAAERVGYKVPAGQATGSRVLQMLEQQLAKHPAGAGSARVFNEGNQQAVNSAAARAMGENATKLTDDVLTDATSRVGQSFQDVASRNTVNVGGDDLLNALTKIDGEQRALGKFSQPRVRSLVDKGLDLAAQGNVDGHTYQVIRSELGKQAKAAYAVSNSTLGDALKTVQKALDTAADNSISAADQEAWQLARKQWQALKLVNTKNGIVEGGNVSAAKLATKVDKAGAVRAPEIRDIAKIGETFKPLPDSGTASNAMMQLLMTGGAGLAGPTALLGSLAAPAAASKLIFSEPGRRYLTKGLLSLTDEQERMLKLLGAGLLSAPATSVAP